MVFIYNHKQQWNRTSTFFRAGIRFAVCLVLTCALSGVFNSDECHARDPKELYMKADRSYRQMVENPSKRQYRQNWEACIERFQQVYRSDPSGPWAAAGLYMSGKLFLELNRYSGRKADEKEATDIFNRIVKRFPKSRYREKAQAELDSLSFNRTREPVKIAQIQKPVLAPEPENHVNDPLLPGAAVVEDLRFWSNPSYTRVVVNADNEITFTHHILKKDPSIGKPPRLYVDMANSRLRKDMQTNIPINDDLLSNVRAGQYTLDSVRVVVDIKSFRSYKIFSLKNPFRIVIDVWGEERQTASDFPVQPATPDSKDKVSPGALAKQLALGVSRIVIDPGHGGKDFGAPGHIKGVHEKDITLQISRRLAKKIEKELGCEVILTRNSDRYLTLEERTAIANTKNADLFISIHTNAAKNSNAHGIETYFLNLATDDDAILVAARENATSTKNISDLQSILNDLMYNAKVNESSRMAGHVQESLIIRMRGSYPDIRDKGVKQAPFYVLLGAQMPSILVETSFISNPKECKRLTDGRYQDYLCEGIFKGIRKYIIELNPTAYSVNHGKDPPG